MTKSVLTKSITGSALMFIGMWIGYSIKPDIYKDYESPLIPPEAQKPYITDVPASFFDTKSTIDFKDEGVIIMDGRFSVKLPPKLTGIDASTIEPINKKLPFPVSLLKSTIKGKPIGGGGFEDKKYDLNVDGNELEFGISVISEQDINDDGSKEMIVRASTHHQHGVGLGAIVNQVGEVVFSTEDLPNFSIFPTKDNNGFYTAEKLTTVGLYGVGGFRLTRYMHQDGKYIPVWTQDEYDPISK